MIKAGHPETTESPVQHPIGRKTHAIQTVLLNHVNDLGAPPSLISTQALSEGSSVSSRHHKHDLTLNVGADLLPTCVVELRSAEVAT
jgi:hypothetical protein